MNVYYTSKINHFSMSWSGALESQKFYIPPLTFIFPKIAIDKYDHRYINICLIYMRYK